MKFGNSELSDWMYVYINAKSYIEGELEDISWFIFDKSDAPENPTIMDTIAATIVTITPITVDGKIESWLVLWKDEKLAKLFWEENEKSLGIYLSGISGPKKDIDEAKKDVDNFLIRMSKLMVFI